MDQNNVKQLIHNEPKCYADACLKKGVDFYDYENVNISWGTQDDYEIIEKIGRGKYSEVYKALNLKTGQQVVVKVLKPIRKKKIKREIKILQNLANGPNIISLLDVVRDPASKTTSLVFNYIDNIDYKQVFPKLSDFDVRFYMFELLKALDFSHSQGIIHRDIKPHNMMIDINKRQLKVIDWGLAEFYLPGKDYNVRVASRYFKAPELLVDYTYYDFSLDMWGFACVLAGIVFMREPFFQGNDNYDQLEKITRILGTTELFAYLEKYNIELDQQFGNVLGQNPKKSLQKLVKPENEHLATKEAVDLLSKILIYDHSQRLTAEQAMKHAYFDPVRQYQQQQGGSGKKHKK